MTWHTGEGKTGSFTVIVCTCGGKISLHDYTIDDDGQVRPHVICPNGCGFNHVVHLDGWNPGKK